MLEYLKYFGSRRQRQFYGLLVSQHRIFLAGKSSSISIGIGLHSLCSNQAWHELSKYYNRAWLWSWWKFKTELQLLNQWKHNYILIIARNHSTKFLLAYLTQYKRRAGTLKRETPKIVMLPQISIKIVYFRTFKQGVWAHLSLGTRNLCQTFFWPHWSALGIKFDMLLFKSSSNDKNNNVFQLCGRLNKMNLSNLIERNF